ncbi:MAG: multiple sugar transport system permease protein [Actinomycetota bacterium]|nr:multiple sugar transport system permease protein [Actinomycetota bacterium]
MTGVRRSGGRKKRYLVDREGFLAPLLLLPAVVYIVALVAIPFFLAIGFSVSDVTVGDPSFDYVGLRNFRAVLADPVFRQALRNSLVITVVTMVLVLVLGKTLALVLTRDFKGRWVVRFLILLPWVTPVSLATIAWLWLLDSLFSPIDWTLRRLGLLEGNLHWLGNPTLAMVSVIAVQVWRILPLAAVIMMAGISAIPQDLNDAADVDGAGFWRKLWEITIPLSLPVTAVAALFGAVLVFTDLGVVYVLTRGGPIDATQVLPTWAFFRGIQGGDLAQGAAVALFLFPLLLAMAILILRAVKRMETL